jgi:hypothetical protein
MTNRKEPGLAFWATVALVVVLLAYPFSFGPACWITAIPYSDFAKMDHQGFSAGRYHPAMVVYWPLAALASQNGRIGTIVRWWMRRGVAPEHLAAVPCNARGSHVIGEGCHRVQWLIPPLVLDASGNAR